MTSLRLAFWAVCIAGGTISSAHACRVYRSPETRIAEAYAAHPDLQVAIVEVEKARYVSNQMLRDGKKKFPAFELPWRAVASVVRVVKGGDSPQLVLFDRGYTDCDPETPFPATGDIWVVYYTVGKELYPATVFECYPLAAARQADLHLKETLAATPLEAHSSP